MSIYAHDCPYCDCAHSGQCAEEVQSENKHLKVLVEDFKKVAAENAQLANDRAAVIVDLKSKLKALKEKSAQVARWKPVGYKDNYRKEMLDDLAQLQDFLSLL